MRYIGFVEATEKWVKEQFNPKHVEKVTEDLLNKFSGTSPLKGFYASAFEAVKRYQKKLNRE